MADKYRIISDGNKTEVFAPDGSLIKRVSSIKIEQYARGPLIAHVTLVIFSPELDIQAGTLNG